MGLVLVFGVMVGKGLVDVAASLEIVCRMYVGYGPGPAKSLHTMSSNSLRVDGSTCNRLQINGAPTFYLVQLGTCTACSKLELIFISPFSNEVGPVV